MRKITFNEAAFCGCASPYSRDEKVIEWDGLSNRGDADVDLKPLELSHVDTLVDIGCGAGYHVLAAAASCRQVHAVDVSSQMIALLESNIRRASVQNVNATIGGFLSVDLLGMGITKAFSWGALHHLPDAWKVEALVRLADALPDGGKFLLMDLVYNFHPRERAIRQDAYAAEIEVLHGRRVAEDLVRAFQTEFITYHDLLVWMLETAGFSVAMTSHLPNQCWANYLCVKGMDL